MTKYLGTAGELLVAAQCSQRGLAVFKELGDNSRIDLIVEDTHKTLHRIQVKCLNRYSGGAIRLDIKKSGPNGYRYHYSEQDIDWFVVVDAQSNRIAWVPIKEALACKHQFSLRLEPAKGGQPCRLFSDYETFPLS
jgi:hypothetical protein